MLSTSSVWAGTGDVASSPIRGVKPKSKLSLTVDSTWAGGNGYRPIRVVLSNAPAAPAVADRNLRVEISPRGAWYGDGDPLTVKALLTIPPGKTATEGIVSVPQGSAWSMLHVEVFEDGRQLRDMPLDVNLLSNNGMGPTMDGVPSFLVLDRDAPTRARRLQLKQANYFMGSNPRPVATYDLPDVRMLASLNGYGNVFYTGTQVDDNTLLQNLYSIPNLELLPPSDLSEKWLDLTCFDVTILPLDELKSMAQKHPEQFAALRDWTAAGGSLVVFGVGEKLEKLPDVEQALNLAAAKPGEPAHPARSWATPNVRSYNANFRLDDNNNNRNQYIYSGPGGATVTAVPMPGGTQAVPPGMMLDQNGNLVPIQHTAPSVALPNLRIRELQLGRIVAVSTADPFPGASEQWSWICQNIGKSNLGWQSRHGVSLSADNTDYWDFLIPGVGMAPVTGFRILISLFVILIGPVNYLLLRRSRRLYLMLVTVPVGATLVTVCLLGYALVTDGLGVRARVRSYTHLDQRTGSAVSWSRQSYYAGLAPSRGMVYPDDTAVYRIVDRRFDMGSQNKIMAWTQHRQNLQSGFITSRITAQYLVVRAHHKSPSRVEITESPGGNEPPRIENRLGTKIQQLALRDSQGDWYLAANVEPGKSVETTKSVAADSVGEIRKLIAQNPPQEPPGFNPNSNNYYGYSRWGSRRFYSYAMRYGGQQVPATMRTSLLELGLRVAGPSGTAPLAPRSYLAVVEKSPEVPLGVESAREEASLHVVVGQW